MPRDKIDTREHIVRRAAEVFNRLGYAGTTVSDLEEATGLKTGGIYRHFPDGKDALALEAFDFAVDLRTTRIRAALAEGRGSAIDSLQHLLELYRNPPVDAIPGGCPAMNAAIEHDSAGLPALRARARATMDRWQAMVADIVAQGRARGEIAANVDPAETATIFLATLEGATMLSGLYGNREPIRTAVTHLARVIDQLRP
jgi:TetR/AcrR family transcriptional regulator, transcriptional repressor for nem operon